MNQARRPGIRGWRSNFRRFTKKWPRRISHPSFRVRTRFGLVALLLHRHDGPKYQIVPHLLLSCLGKTANLFSRKGITPGLTQESLSRAKVPLPIMQARCLPGTSRNKNCVFNCLTARSLSLGQGIVTKSYVPSRGEPIAKSPPSTLPRLPIQAVPLFNDPIWASTPLGY